MDHVESEKTMEMPAWIANDPATAANGKVLFETFCSVCHGADAKSGGALGPNYPVPPNLVHEAYKSRGDGFFFHTITFGSQSTLMPGYGYAISVHERWMIVKHLRNLQAAAQ
jgi:mono/diheme cytochrome c family protein